VAAGGYGLARTRPGRRRDEPEAGPSVAAGPELAPEPAAARAPAAASGPLDDVRVT
jgi:hypothetical protein